MAGKNTAAFGIYPNKIALEEGLVIMKEPKILPMKKRLKPLKGRQQAPAQAGLSAVCWDGSPE
jgi:hypothetical protein